MHYYVGYYLFDRFCHDSIIFSEHGEATKLTIFTFGWALQPGAVRNSFNVKPKFRIFCYFLVSILLKLPKNEERYLHEGLLLLGLARGIHGLCGSGVTATERKVKK